jgi:DNA-binding transcriptional regulator of glucitol operon
MFAFRGEPNAQSAVILLDWFLNWLQKKNFFRVFELINHVGDVANWRFLVMTEPNHVARAVQAVKHGFDR